MELLRSLVGLIVTVLPEIVVLPIAIVSIVVPASFLRIIFPVPARIFSENDKMIFRITDYFLLGID